MGFLFGLRCKDKEGIKCEHLIKYDRTKVQISGLSLGDYKLGEFGIDPKLLQAASHALMLLDATQYDLCIAIKGITDNKLRDFYYKKMIDDKIRSQNIIRVIASLSMDPKSKQLQDTLKDLIISNQQIVIEIEDEMKKSNLSQQPEPTDQKILGNSIDVGTSSFKDKMQQMDAAPLEPDKVKEQTDERLQFYEILSDKLRGSRRSFVDQIKVRTQLEELLVEDKRKEVQDILNKNYQYERMFSELFPILNNEEKKLFDFIRRITHTMADYNSQMYKLLKDMKNRKFWKEIPRLEDLYYHLELWLEKFEALKDREDVCLIYVGVEEGRPFPAGIEDDVKDQMGHL